MEDEVLFAAITELGARLAKREFSSRELAEAYLKRLGSLGPRYNALASLLEESAIEQAEAADRLFAAGVVRTPLQGIPYGAKDLLAARGAPTSWGAETFRRQRFDYDATVIQRLAEAGAVLAAKLSMVRFAGGGGYHPATESMHGPGRNPWDPRRWSGGSSSGPGIAVAAALASFAIGSETWGSIATPASYCGVTGLRPTYGLVSRYGAMAVSWTMDKLGPMGRSAEDCALVLEQMAAPDPKDPSHSGRKFQYSPEPRPLGQLRAGFAEEDLALWAEPETRPVFHEALQELRRAGLALRSVSLPPMPYSDTAGTIITADVAAVFEDLIRSEEFESLPDERQKAGLRKGLEIPAVKYLRAMRSRRLIQQALAERFEQVDIFVTPGRLETPPLINDPAQESRRRTPNQENRGNIDLGAAGNLAGLPALIVPCGWTAGGLPVGLSFVGRPFAENTLIAIGKAFQQRTDWHQRRPRIE